MDMVSKDKIIRARVALQKTHPFFSYIALHLTMIQAEEKDCPTMGVDAKGNCYYSAKFVNGLSAEEVKGVLSHEIMHVVLEHLKAIKGRDARLVDGVLLANIAQDICINDIIQQNNLALPKGGLIPNNHTIKVGDTDIKDINKKVWEMIYDELYKKSKKTKMPSFDQHIRNGGGTGNDKDGKGTGDKDGKEIKGVTGSGEKNTQDYPYKQIVNEAYAYAKLQGKEPGGVDRIVDELNYPKINWREMLRKFIVREIPYDYCYTRPSKKSASCGVFIPSVYKEALEIAIGVDTSGSMSPDDLRECLSECLGIVKAFSNVKLTVLSCDAKVHTIGEVSTEDDIHELKLQGGGGTDFRPVFEWLEENKPSVRILIFFTDGFGEFPTDAPNMKTLWCITERGIDLKQIPFGEAVTLDLRKQEEGD